jgi:hypothetical protein
MEPPLKMDFQQRFLATVPLTKVTDGFLSCPPLLTMDQRSVKIISVLVR